MNKLSIEALKKLLKLLKDERLIYSDFSNKSLLKKMENQRVISLTATRPKVIVLESLSSAFYFLEKSYGYRFEDIESLENYIELQNNNSVLTKDEIAKNNIDTKEIESKSFNGIRVNCIEDIHIKKNSKYFIVPPIQGGATFLFYKEHVVLDKNTTVVGVENPQVLWYINKYKYLFDETKKYLFVLILDQTTYVFEWLKSIQNEYIHFGDFDLAGISIYLNKVKPKLTNCKKSSFLIPDNIAPKIKKEGSRKLFNKQERYKESLSKTIIADSNLRKLVEVISDSKKALEQEYLHENI